LAGVVSDVTSSGGWTVVSLVGVVRVQRLWSRLSLETSPLRLAGTSQWRSAVHWQRRAVEGMQLWTLPGSVSAIGLDTGWLKKPIHSFIHSYSFNDKKVDKMQPYKIKIKSIIAYANNKF